MIQILLADDSAEFRVEMKRELKTSMRLYLGLECRFSEFSDWGEAFTEIRDKADLYDLIIVDILWPPRGLPEAPVSEHQERGFRLIQEAGQRTPTVPILGISSGTTPTRDFKARALGTGASLFRYWGDLTTVEGDAWEELATDIGRVTGLGTSNVADANVAGSVNGDRKAVFVIHGRSPLHEQVSIFLESLGLRVVDFATATRRTRDEQGATVFILEILRKAFRDAWAAIVVMTPDDEARLRSFREGRDDDFEGELRGQARPNVLFEAGMAIGLNPERTILVQSGALRPFSDIDGVHVLRLSNGPRDRKSLRDQLASAGLDIDVDSDRYLQVGDLDPEDSETSDEESETDD